VTSAELCRLADRDMSEAADLSADAARLESQAASLRGLLEPLIGMSQRAWIGPAAEEFEANVRTSSGQIDEQAQRLADIALTLHADAARLRREAGSLRRQASAIDAATAAGCDVPIPVGAVW
jgi:uncharacterized protein YukE